MKRLTCTLLSFVLMTCVLAACSLEKIDNDAESTAKNQVEEEIQPTSSIMITEEQVKNQKEKVVMVLYFADNQASKLVAEKRFIPKSTVSDLNAMAEQALKELAKGPISGNLTSPMPKGVPEPKVKVNQKTATVDLTKEFVEKHPGGSTGETLTVYSIVNTLTGINGIDTVQFTIDGKKVQEFKGHLEFDKPFTANTEIIKEEQKKE